MDTWTFGQIKIEGFQNEPQEGYIELTPDAGVPYRRERFSDIQDIVKGNFTLEKARYIDFMSWYKVNLRQGTLPFKFFDCRIKKERVARIIGKPTYTTNSKFFDISITIAFDSEVFYSEDKYLVANPDYALEVNGKLLVANTRWSL